MLCMMVYSKFVIVGALGLMFFLRDSGDEPRSR